MGYWHPSPCLRAVILFPLLLVFIQLSWVTSSYNKHLFKYSSKIHLKECRKRSTHPPQPFFTYIFTHTYGLWRKLNSIVVIPIYSPLLYFQKKKEKQKCILPLCFHSSSVLSFDLFFICHEDQRTVVSEK